MAQVDYYDIAQWAQLSGPYVTNADYPFSPMGDIAEAPAWRVSRWMPNLGEFHLAWWRFNSPVPYGGIATPGALYIQAPGLPGGYSARVDPADTVDWRVNAFVTHPGGTPNIMLGIYFYNQGGSPIMGVTDIFDMEVSDPTEDPMYAEHQIVSSSPPGSYLARCIAVFGSAGPVNPGCITCIDSGTLAVR